MGCVWVGQVGRSVVSRTDGGFVGCVQGGWGGSWVVSKVDGRGVVGWVRGGWVVLASSDENRW